jgi:hypothetical protein
MSAYPEKTNALINVVLDLVMDLALGVVKGIVEGVALMFTHCVQLILTEKPNEQ